MDDWICSLPEGVPRWGKGKVLRVRTRLRKSLHFHALEAFSGRFEHAISRSEIRFSEALIVHEWLSRSLNGLELSAKRKEVESLGWQMNNQLARAFIGAFTSEKLEKISRKIPLKYELFRENFPVSSHSLLRIRSVSPLQWPEAKHKQRRLFRAKTFPSCSNLATVARYSDRLGRS